MNTHRTETARFPRPSVIRPIHVIPAAFRHSTHSRHSHGLPSFDPFTSFPRPHVIRTHSRHSHGLTSFPRRRESRMVPLLSYIT